MTAMHTFSAVPLALAQAADVGGFRAAVELAAGLSTILIAFALLVIALTLATAAWKSRRVYRRAKRMLELVEGEMEPILAHASDVAENLNYVTSALRSDVERFQGTLDGARQRLDRAAAMTEARIKQFNALLEVVQDEAEQIFIDTASTLRGVRVGARGLRSPDGARAWSGIDEEEDTTGPDAGARSHHT